MEIYLNLPPYLKEWFIHECCRECWLPGMPEPVCELAKGSLEASLLRTALRSPRVGEDPMIRCPEGWTRVRVPVFRGINLDSRNYLPDKGRFALESCIRSRFDLDLWDLISHRDFKIANFKDALSAWMDSRGIEDDEINWMAIDKRAQRLRRRAVATMRQRERRRNKNPENPKKIS